MGSDYKLDSFLRIFPNENPRTLPHVEGVPEEGLFVERVFLSRNGGSSWYDKAVLTVCCAIVIQVPED